MTKLPLASGCTMRRSEPEIVECAAEEWDSKVLSSLGDSDMRAIVSQALGTPIWLRFKTAQYWVGSVQSTP